MFPRAVFIYNKTLITCWYCITIQFGPGLFACYWALSCDRLARSTGHMSCYNETEVSSAPNDNGYRQPRTAPFVLVANRCPTVLCFWAGEWGTKLPLLLSCVPCAITCPNAQLTPKKLISQ